MTIDTCNNLDESYVRKSCQANKKFLISYILYNSTYIVFFFFKKINLFELEDNYFALLWWILHYINMNQPWVHMYSPHPEPPSYLPPYIAASYNFSQLPAQLPPAAASGSVWNSIFTVKLTLSLFLQKVHPPSCPELSFPFSFADSFFSTKLIITWHSYAYLIISFSPWEWG